MFAYRQGQIFPHYLWDKDGRIIEDYLMPLPDMRTEGAVAESVGEDSEVVEAVQHISLTSKF